MKIFHWVSRGGGLLQFLVKQTDFESTQEKTERLHEDGNNLQSFTDFGALKTAAAIGLEY